MAKRREIGATIEFDLYAVNDGDEVRGQGYAIYNGGNLSWPRSDAEPRRQNFSVHSPRAITDAGNIARAAETFSKFHQISHHARGERDAEVL